MATRILRPTAPNLPYAPIEYSREYTEQLNNVSRLYFNQLTNAIGALTTALNTVEDQTGSTQTLIWLDM